MGKESKHFQGPVEVGRDVVERPTEMPDSASVLAWLVASQAKGLEELGLNESSALVTVIYRA